MNYLPANEPVLNYAPGSQERDDLKKAIIEARSKHIEISMVIGGQKIQTGNKINLSPPHDHQHILGHYHEGGKKEIEQAIAAALAAKEKWMLTSSKDRSKIFLKAADLIAG